MSADRAVRLGDAEREAAVAALGEHYAAGRITKEEYDERSDQVWAARFPADLRPLFADLPGAASAPERAEAPFPSSERPARASWQERPWPARWTGAWPGPFAGVAALALVVVAIATGTPWLLFFLFLLTCGAPGGRRHGWGARRAGFR